MRLEADETVGSKVTNWLQTIIYNGQEMKRWGRKEYLQDLLDALTPLGNFPRKFLKDVQV
jgi:hypothetical protein